MQRIQNQRGSTMIEAIVASSILLLVSLITMGMFVGGYRNTATSGRLTIAVNLARAQLELIRSTPFQEIPASFPANEGTPGTLTELPEGQWFVSYPEGTSGDPLAVKLTVRWTEDEVSHEIVLDTLIANTDL